MHKREKYTIDNICVLALMNLSAFAEHSFSKRSFYIPTFGFTFSNRVISLIIGILLLYSPFQYLRFHFVVYFLLVGLVKFSCYVPYKVSAIMSASYGIFKQFGQLLFLAFGDAC